MLKKKKSQDLYAKLRVNINSILFKGSNYTCGVEFGRTFKRSHSDGVTIDMLIKHVYKSKRKYFEIRNLVLQDGTEMQVGTSYEGEILAGIRCYYDGDTNSLYLKYRTGDKKKYIKLDVKEKEEKS